MPQFSLSRRRPGLQPARIRMSRLAFATSLSLNGKALTSDIKCKDPLNPTTDLVVFSVLSSAAWEIGVTDAIYFSGQISAPSRNQVSMLTLPGLESPTWGKVQGTMSITSESCRQDHICAFLRRHRDAGPAKKWVRI